ncbi:ABC transporter ATP-binding protein [Roseovarius sp.]|uniref:ABC transporter ATP-binding protein n=1 Tax=Roseovarius sp. TaxID=1486281 RepID=UPI003D0F36FA
MRDMPLAQIENLGVTFRSDAGYTVAVRDVSFDILPGETLAIVGESGSGKSVTSLALMRLVGFEGGRITGGRLMFDAGSGPLDLGKLTQKQMRSLRGARIGMIFQEPVTALNPVFTIGRQLTEGLRKHKRLSRAAARAKALELLQEVRLSEPERRLSQFPHELSGGMRQRVMIAMALACEPRLLIADEPTTALDVTTQAEILALIDHLRHDHATAVLFITHDMAVVAQVADRVVVLKDGEKIEGGPVSQVFSSPSHPYTRKLLGAVPRLGDMRGKPAPEPFALDPEAPPKPIPGQGTELLRVEHLCTRFPVRGGLLRQIVGRVHAVEDVSFSINAGQTLALVGESGCGKSTVGRSLLRLVEPDRGRISLGGQDITALPAAELRRARAQMQMIFQDPYGSLNPVLRLAEQVAEPLRNFTNQNKAQRTDRVTALFDRVGLPGSFLDRYPHELSGGQRQRVAIARALALNPKLIVADEAVSALDVSVQAQVLNLLMELQAELGLSYLFISHDMAVVERVSHHIAVMYAGRIVERGPRAVVLEDPRHPYTRALLRAVPVADPDQRRLISDLSFKPIPSPIHPKDHDPGPSLYREVSRDHVVLTSDCGY